MRLFEGIEVEGRHKGKHTLFVEGRVPVQSILATIAQVAEHRHAFEQVYFGAEYRGRNASLAEATAAACVASTYPDVIVTIDCREPRVGIVELLSVFSNVEMMISLQSSLHQKVARAMYEIFKSGHAHQVQVKFRGPKIVVFPLESAMINLRDEIYEDKLL